LWMCTFVRALLALALQKAVVIFFTN
jgi:hypothetical protein